MNLGKSYNKFLAEARLGAENIFPDMDVGEGFLPYLKRLKFEYEDGGITYDSEQFYNSLGNYYQGEAKIDRDDYANFEAQKAFELINRAKKFFPELRPDYSVMYRGRHKHPIIVRQLMGGRSWKPYGADWLVTSGVSYAVPGHLSSWTPRQATAMLFMGIYANLQITTNGAAYNMTHQELSDSLNLWAGRYPKLDVGGITVPYILRKRPDGGTIFSRSMGTSVSKIFGFPRENEVVQLGKGPYTVDIMMHRVVHKHLSNQGYLRYE